MDYTLRIADTQVQWSQEQVRHKLESIRDLPNKSYAWIRSDLEVTQSWLMTRIIWTILIKYFIVLRELCFGVNLAVSHSIFSQLRQQIHNDPVMETLFREAVLNFGQIAPHYAIEMPALAQPANLNQIDAIVSPIIPIPQPPDELSVANLMPYYARHWNPVTMKFNPVAFDSTKFKDLVQSHNELYPIKHDLETDFGIIEKKHLPPETEMSIRADIHGDLMSLFSLLKNLQNEGLIDEQFQCKPNTHLTFLGDYMDRGEHQMEVLQLLILLRMENPDQVTLIRGNHEALFMNRNSRSPCVSAEYNMDDTKSAELMENLYQSFPLSVYFSQSNDIGVYEYIQCTHAMFEPHHDPAPLIDSTDDYDYMVVPKEELNLSERIKQLRLIDESSPKISKKAQAHLIKMKFAANHLERIVKEHCSHNRTKEGAPSNPNDQLTAYNWGDIAVSKNGQLPKAIFGALGKKDREIPHDRKWKITPEVIQAYFDLSSSSKNRVKFLIRGHEHKIAHHRYGDKVIVTTLPIAMDVGPHTAVWFPNQKDIAYILKTANKVRNWTKRAILRDPGTFNTTFTQPHFIRSEEI